MDSYQYLSIYSSQVALTSLVSLELFHRSSLVADLRFHVVLLANFANFF